MSFALIFLFIFDILLLTALFVLYKKLTQKPTEDPRLSRGLQLLQSKISILEDLSDRTDKQVDKLIQLLELKAAEVQKKLKASDDQIKQLELSMNKSREVAELFEDKIPHHEVIERESSVLYIKAAQMAHRGHSADEICRELPISKGEAEFIVKVNKKELMFDEKQLPEWAKVSLKKLDKKNSSLVEDQFSKFNISFDEPKKDIEEMKRIGDEFREACKQQSTSISPTMEIVSTPETISDKEERRSQAPQNNEVKSPETPIENQNFIPIKTLGVQTYDLTGENKNSDGDEKV